MFTPQYSILVQITKTLSAGAIVQGAYRNLLVIPFKLTIPTIFGNNSEYNIMIFLIIWED